MMKLLRKLGWYFVLLDVVLGSAILVTDCRANPNWRASALFDRAIGIPAARQVSAAELQQPDSITLGGTLARQGLRGLEDRLAYTENVLGCRPPSSWHVHRYPSVMIVYPVHPARGFVMVSDLEVRPWSFDGLKGRYNVAVLCA